MPERLPLLLSVPHAGLTVPDFLQPYCRLTEAEIAADGDVGSRQIYDLADEVLAFATTEVARAILDLNRAEGDNREDGIVKTHTCWGVPIWDPQPADELFEQLIDQHHRPYHRQLAEFAGDPGVVLSLDCHTMATAGPPVGPDPGAPRPMICLGDGAGTTCPREWVERMQECMARHFPGPVTINEPFAGGHITRSHGRRSPWLQVEMSRMTALPHAEKRERFLAALRDWCTQAG